MLTFITNVDHLKLLMMIICVMTECVWCVCVCVCCCVCTCVVCVYVCLYGICMCMSVVHLCARMHVYVCAHVHGYVYVDSYDTGHRSPLSLTQSCPSNAMKMTL